MSLGVFNWTGTIATALSCNRKSSVTYDGVPLIEWRERRQCWPLLYRLSNCLIILNHGHMTRKRLSWHITQPVHRSLDRDGFNMHQSSTCWIFLKVTFYKNAYGNSPSPDSLHTCWRSIYLNLGPSGPKSNDLSSTRKISILESLVVALPRRGCLGCYIKL